MIKPRRKLLGIANPIKRAFFIPNASTTITKTIKTAAKTLLPKSLSKFLTDLDSSNK